MSSYCSGCFRNTTVRQQQRHQQQQQQIVQQYRFATVTAAATAANATIPATNDKMMIAQDAGQPPIG
jgi:hypothetical protein